MMAEQQNVVQSDPLVKELADIANALRGEMDLDNNLRLSRSEVETVSECLVRLEALSGKLSKALSNESKGTRDDNGKGDEVIVNKTDPFSERLAMFQRLSTPKGENIVICLI